MSAIGKSQRATQSRVVALFRDEWNSHLEDRVLVHGNKTVEFR